MDFEALRGGNVSPRVSPCGPAGFRGIQGSVESAYESLTPSFGKKRVSTNAARKAGIAYERLAIEYLQRSFSGRTTRAGTWIGFRDLSGMRSCQPDFFVLDAKRVIVFEIKLSHCELAWFQLNALYGPVLRALYARPVVCVEMCKRFDPQTSWPEEIGEVFHSVEKLISALAPESTHVLRWRPRRG